jgi:hypothetical protein
VGNKIEVFFGGFYWIILKESEGVFECEFEKKLVMFRENENGHLKLNIFIIKKKKKKIIKKIF